MVSNPAVKHKFIFRLMGLAAGHGIFHRRFRACLHLITLIYLVEYLKVITDMAERK